MNSCIEINIANKYDIIVTVYYFSLVFALDEICCNYKVKPVRRQLNCKSGKHK